MKDTYSLGMAIAIWSVFGLLGIISVLEVYCDVRRWPTISNRIAGWARVNRWLSAAIVAALFILLAHFVLNPLHPTTCNC